MLSFWERESFTRYHLLVIGSGIVGLSTAIAYRQLNPTHSVAILERGLLPTGASTKNAGFACIGSPTELLSDLQTMPTHKVVELVALRHKGLAILRNRLGDAAIDYRQEGSYEILRQEELLCLDKLTELNELLYPVLGGNAYSVAPQQLREQFGFSPHFARAMVISHFEGQIDTGKMMQALLHDAQKQGITILSGAEVTAFSDAGSSVQVQVTQLPFTHSITLRAAKLAVCTNAFTPSLLPQVPLEPGRGQVIVTHPVANLPFKGIFHFDEGYYYFRNFGNRIIFGGGRNLSFAAENTTELTTTEHIINNLTHKLREDILPHTPVQIDMQWAGIMAFGQSKFPILEQISPCVVIGVKLSGMGVAIGSALGEQIAQMLNAG